MTITARPPMTYFGGKQTLAERITALLPAHLHYVEPFCGSLAVLLAKPLSRMETVNDLDRELMTFWRVLRDRSEDLERVCALTPHSRAEYEAVLAAEPTKEELEVARRVWVRLSQGRGGQLRRTTGWRYFAAGRGSNLSMPGYLEAYRARLGPCLDRLAQVSLECRPALDVIDEYGRDDETLLYVDPPYLGTTRNWGNQYRHELRDEASHRELAAALVTARAAVVVSGYPSPLYEELFAGWDRITLTARTGQGGASGERTEVLWSNRPLGAVPTLFDQGAMDTETSPTTGGAP
jgi:DNA adenine methylase